ncbi:LysR family transcriptional regulator [Caulobacter zeae]|uniref:LysR family transcriptional regulator n=1 Tax=Caulobacter zeae TaxID=2055137 RepID=A0A2N5DRR5_9CAUL|nr:LysR family transcriptional regulator [Caulobacter zeae]PLR28734.1 LysR family transcriptional regulator [Caulobacter zeae]
MDRLLSMECFVRTVETGGFSSAARDMGLSQPNVSRYVAALEAHLQQRLLQRSTRKLHLTPEGERYYVEARRILDAVSEAESALKSDVRPSGLLRVACPTAFAHEFLMPQVPKFLRAYPDLDLDLQISDRFVNLIDDGVELALRIGHLSDSALRARRVGLFTRICVAQSDYLDARGTPQTPQDLKHHDCIVYSLLSTGATWRFADVEVAVSGRLRVSAPQAAREAALAGLGVALGPHWLFEEGLKSGRLQRILTGYEAEPVPIHILYVANRLLPRRAMVFMDYMAAAFSKVETLNMRLSPSIAGDDQK